MKNWLSKLHSAVRGHGSKRLRFSASPDPAGRAAEAEASPLAWRSLVRLSFLGMTAAGAIFLMTVSLNLLILGTDDVDYAKHTDTIILVHWNPLPRRLSLLSIPRDTLIQMPKRGAIKINAVYAYGLAMGTREYALAMTRAAVESLLGIKMHYVVHIRYSNFIQLVDTLGGVPIYVEKPMHYIDQAGGVNINLEAEYQLLDGRQSLDYVRFRHDQDGDIGRIRRQQSFVRAFVGQLLQVSRAPKTIKAFFTFLECVETNVNLPTAIFLAMEIKGVANSSWRQAILPGTATYINGYSYWRPDVAEIRRVISELGRPAQKKSKPKPMVAAPTIQPETTPEIVAAANRAATGAVPQPAGVAPRQLVEAGPRLPAVKPTPAIARQLRGQVVPLATPKPTPQRRLAALPAGKQPVVRVLNGCGVSGVAVKITRRLMDNRITVRDADMTNAPSFDFPYSIVKTRANNLAWAKYVVAILGIDESHIQIIPSRTAYPTVTVVIGKDYQELLK